MSENTTFRIVLAVDGSPHSEAAVQFVSGMTWSAPASVQVLVVTPQRWSLSGLNAESETILSTTLTSLQRADRTAAEQLGEQVVNALHTHNLSATAKVCEGRPSSIILQHASELHADLIVIGAKGIDASDSIQLGSTAYKVANYATTPVLVARPLIRPQPLSVIFAADGSPEARRAAKFLCALALPRWAEITLVSVAELRLDIPTGKPPLIAAVPDIVRCALLDSAESQVHQIVECLKYCDAHVKSAIRLGHPAREILSAAQELDANLIVVGARSGARTESAPLGGVAQRIVKQAPCSVLIAR